MLALTFFASTSHYAEITGMQRALAQTKQDVCTFCTEDMYESATITLSCERIHQPSALKSI